MKLRLSMLALFVLALFSAPKLFAEQQILILLGPPGAGKGVLSKKLSKDSGLPRISAGDLLRQEQENKNSPLAIEVAEYMREGQLVPDDVIVRVLMHRINKPDCKKGFILDGFPRTVEQAKILDKTLPSEYSMVVVNLKVDDETTIQRLLGRRVCSKCNQRYHIEFFPPKREDVCDNCNGVLVARGEDCTVAIRARLEAFHNKAQAIESFYQDAGKLVNVDATGAVEKNYSTLLDQVHAIDLDFVVLDADS